MKKSGEPPDEPPKDSIKLGFDTKLIDLRLDQIVPLKLVTDTAHASPKYKQILTSIRAVGIIEPPVVTRDTAARNRYILLDGHLRLKALQELGEKEVTCLVSTDVESFTYNKHVNRLSAIQEHRMIAKAVKRGVSEEKIAEALCVDVAQIVRKRNLVEGICPEAIDLLKDKIMSGSVFPLIRRMKPVRQVEVAGLMNDTGTYTYSYAKVLFAATPQDQLVEPSQPKKVKGLDAGQMERMENEMANVQDEYRLIEESYGTDVLNLTIAKTYLLGLLGNARVVRYLAQHHAEILAQFQKVTEMTSLTVSAAA